MGFLKTTLYQPLNTSAANTQAAPSLVPALVARVRHRPKQIVLIQLRTSPFQITLATLNIQQ